MSGFAFSHQFSKRWLATPAPVKHAIIQELDDIVTLLQPDTDLEQYQFSVPNLHEKIEELLAIERAHQEKLLAEERLRQLEEQQRLEAERLAQAQREAQRLEQERLKAERLAQERLAAQQLEAERQEHVEAERQERERENARLQPESAHAEREEQAELDVQRLQHERQAQDEAQIAALEQERAIAKQAHLAKQASLAQQAIETSTSSITLADADTNASTISIERHSSDMVYAIDNTAEPITSLTTSENSASDKGVASDAAAHNAIATTSDLETIKQDIIKQLQGDIENYLLESMTLMNEDLNKWLKTEVEKQLNARLAQSH